MSGTNFPQGRVLGPNGDFTQPWRMFFQNVYLATGGAGSAPLVLADTTVNGHPLSSNVVVTRSDIGLSNVSNDAQTKASIVPNTTPSAAQLLVGNAGGTAYAPVSSSGDVTVSSLGVFTISAKAVTYAKIQDVSASVLLGRGAGGGAGSPQEIALGTGLAMTGTTLSVSGVGSVSSVSVVSANGFAGTVATPSTTPAITLTTSASGVLKGSGGSIVAAVSGTDYVAPTSTDLIVANVTLGAPGTSLSSGAFSTYKNLRVRIYLPGYAGSDTASLQFNGAAGTAYRYRWWTMPAGSVVAAAGLTAASTDRIKIAAANTTNARVVECIVSNDPNVTEKLVKFVGSLFGTGSAGTQATEDGGNGAWISGAATQITSISLVSTSNMLAGTQITVFGWN